VLRKYPFVAQSLFDAFEAAKEKWLTELHAGEVVLDRDKYADVMPFVGNDPLPNGLEANRATLETLVNYAFQQKQIPRRVPIEEIFLDVQKSRVP
jgi:4,5-dihydroxyphthalate decarboxylase